MSRQYQQAGFTLIELLVALVVSAMAVAAAAALFNALGDRAATIDRAAARVDGDANGERLLRAAVANLAPPPADDTSPSFAGDVRVVSFHSWCETAAGWLDRCSARLEFQRSGVADVLQLQLRGAEAETIDVRRGFSTGRFRYLVNAQSRGTWVDEWTNRTPPEAVAVIADADTLILPVWSGSQ